MILRALKHMHFAQHADNCQHTLQNAFGNERMIDEKRVLPLGAGTLVLTFVKPNLNMTCNIYIYIYIYMVVNQIRHGCGNHCRIAILPVWPHCIITVF